MSQPVLRLDVIVNPAPSPVAVLQEIVVGDGLVRVCEMIRQVNQVAHDAARFQLTVKTLYDADQHIRMNVLQRIVGADEAILHRVVESARIRKVRRDVERGIERLEIDLPIMEFTHCIPPIFHRR